MSKPLLDKARAILAQPKQGPPPMAITIDPEESKVTMTDQNFEIQSAAPNVRAIYWETGDGRILGPAVPEFLGRDGNTFWISTVFDGQIRWIHADRLRSKKSFDAQRTVQEVELIREVSHVKEASRTSTHGAQYRHEHHGG